MSKGRLKSKKTIEQEMQEMQEMDNYLKDQLRTFQYKINCKFKNKKQKELFDTILHNRITFVRGSAGTGKTLISLMAGLECLKDQKMNIGQIVLTKPIVEITSQKGLGALPGDINEKTLAYYTHFYDNLIKLIGSYQTKYLKDNGFIKEKEVQQEELEKKIQEFQEKILEKTLDTLVTCLQMKILKEQFTE